MASNVVLSTQDYNVIGTRPIRHDGTDKVTGRAQYAADIDLAGPKGPEYESGPCSSRVGHHGRHPSGGGTRPNGS